MHNRSPARSAFNEAIGLGWGAWIGITGAVTMIAFLVAASAYFIFSPSRAWIVYWTGCFAAIAITFWYARSWSCPICGQRANRTMPTRGGMLRPEVRFTSCCGFPLDATLTRDTAEAEQPRHEPIQDSTAFRAALARRHWIGVGLAALIPAAALVKRDPHLVIVLFLFPVCAFFVRMRKARCPRCGGTVRLSFGRAHETGPLAPNTYTHRYCTCCGTNLLPDLA